MVIWSDSVGRRFWLILIWSAVFYGLLTTWITVFSWMHSIFDNSVVISVCISSVCLSSLVGLSPSASLSVRRTVFLSVRIPVSRCLRFLSVSIIISENIVLRASAFLSLLTAGHVRRKSAPKRHLSTRITDLRNYPIRDVAIHQRLLAVTKTTDDVMTKQSNDWRHG